MAKKKKKTGVKKEGKKTYKIIYRTTLPEGVKKRRKKAYRPHKKTYRAALPDNDFEIEKVLIENFVSLQKVMVNLSVKFENLTHQISKLLDLFEISAKTLAEKEYDTGKEKESVKVVEKIEELMEQNKTIARGLTLMHDRMSEQGSFQMPSVEMIRVPVPASQRMPPKPIPKPAPAAVPVTKDEGEYHRSISSNRPRTQ